MNRCFVIQPFDGGDFDDRFDEVLKPAIAAADLEAYRVDRDPSANIPIEKIEQEIRDSAAVLADISIDNPNVWLEVGLAIAFARPCCLICGPTREKFPFDIVHRRVIKYQTGSPAAFDKLRASITERLSALVKQEEQRREALKSVTTSPVAGGLDNHEIAVLISIASEELSEPEGASGGHIERSIADVGFNRLAAGLGARALLRRGYITESVESDFNGNSYKTFRLTSEGESWMLENVQHLALKSTPQARATSHTSNIPVDDIPF